MENSGGVVLGRLFDIRILSCLICKTSLPPRPAVVLSNVCREVSIVLGKWLRTWKVLFRKKMRL
jgi:hypothetical protein